MPCMPRRILLLYGLSSGSSGVAPSAGHCRVPADHPTPALQPGDPGPPRPPLPLRPESALPSGPTRARPTSTSLRRRHETIPSRAGDGRQSKAVFLRCPHPAKSRFMLRGSAAPGWSRRRRFHDSSLANQAAFHTPQNPALSQAHACPHGTRRLAAFCLPRFA